MAAKSDYFRAVMSSQLKEAKENRVIIEDVDPEIMKTVIEFCYTNQVSLNDDNIDQLLSAAFRFCMESLKKLCVDSLEPRIAASNCARLIRSLQQYSLEDLLDKAIGFCLENFDLVCETPGFLDIDEDIWEILLPDEGLNLSESGIFRALVKWTEHDLENRKAAFERLVKHVRFATIDATELSELSSLGLATLSESCKELIAKAKYYLETGDEPLPEVSASPRRNLKSRQRMYALGGCRYILCSPKWIDLTFTDTLSSVEIYDPTTDKWTEAAPMQSPRQDFGCAVLGDYIYVAGGLDTYKSLGTSERYSIADNTWQSLPDMLKPRQHLGLVALDGYLYAIGGSYCSEPLYLVERFRPGDTKWHECRPMLNPRRGAAYIALDGYIYAIWGDKKFPMTATLERYDPKTDSWCSLSSVSPGCELFQCTSHKGMIYIISWPHLQLFTYNPSTDMWSMSRKGRRLPCIRFVQLSGQLYAVGGSLTKDSAVRHVVSINPKTKKATRRAGMISNRARYGLIVHPQRNFPDRHSFALLFKE